MFPSPTSGIHPLVVVCKGCGQNIAENAGADVIVAQGMEAGGHRRASTQAKQNEKW
jgi:NAD(P)H-dependent flavin oxidoreductase YrpB (nitropropane dioxygenase family)